MIIDFEDIQKKLEAYCRTDVELTQHFYKHTTQLELGFIRLVSPKRKRKLWKKRGVVCNWSNELNSYFWFSEDMGNPKQEGQVKWREFNNENS